MTPLRDHDDLGTTPHGGRPHLRPVGGPAPLALDDAAADLLFREAHTAYPVSVQVQPSTNKAANRAPWGLGANFVEFYPANGSSLTLTFDGMDGFAWRAMVVAAPAKGNSPPTVWEIPLNSSSAGTFTVAGIGTRWGVVTLIPTIVDRAGSEVPFAYTAEVH